MSAVAASPVAATLWWEFRWTLHPVPVMLQSGRLRSGSQSQLIAAVGYPSVQMARRRGTISSAHAEEVASHGGLARCQAPWTRLPLRSSIEQRDLVTQVVTGFMWWPAL